MTPDHVFLDGLAAFSAVVVQLGPGDWERTSPCAGWRALDVLGHVGSAVRFGAALLSEGEAQWKPVDPPGNAVEGDPVQWWESIASSARDAVAGTDLSRVFDAPRGPRSVADGLSFPALDLFVHAWDLGRTAGIAVVVPPEVIEFGHHVIDPIPAGQVRSASVFADEQPAPAGATPSDAFIAWTGRDPQWSPA
ncbi:MAG TPA: TIGR03086 family metal-binding protein [Acidimicrobiales bacterium]|nr:TIGR03086 family metal-binding protein [Acidimicrobiales bacterium]